MQKLDNELKTKNSNFKVINLEELSSDPKKISKELFDFLNIEWSESSINLKKDNIIKTASSIQLRKPIEKHDLSYLKNYHNIFKEIGNDYKWFKN